MEGTGDLLYQNNGDGTFTDLTDSSGIGAHPGRGLGVASNDWDGDGKTDILVANHGVPPVPVRQHGQGELSRRRPPERLGV